jgi:tetratricopeptide (TPR) repeat protein
MAGTWQVCGVPVLNSPFIFHSPTFEPSHGSSCYSPDVAAERFNIMNTKALSLVTAAAFVLSATTAHAIGGGGSKPEPGTKPSKISKCKRGETAKRVKRNGTYKWVCVKLKANVLPDTQLYNNARALAELSEYEWALDHLRLIANQNDPEVLNYMGYANRKAGRLETGIAYYQQALTLKPDYVEAREYLGEAFVLAGFNDKALEQLGAIKGICGTGCDAYTTLDAFIKSNGESGLIINTSSH